MFRNTRGRVMRVPKDNNNNSISLRNNFFAITHFAEAFFLKNTAVGDNGVRNFLKNDSVGNFYLFEHA